MTWKVCLTARRQNEHKGTLFTATVERLRKETKLKVYLFVRCHRKKTRSRHEADGILLSLKCESFAVCCNVIVQKIIPPSQCLSRHLILFSSCFRNVHVDQIQFHLISLAREIESSHQQARCFLN